MDPKYDRAKRLTEAPLKLFDSLAKKLGFRAVENCVATFDFHQPGITEVFVVCRLLEERILDVGITEIVFEVLAYFLPGG